MDNMQLAGLLIVIFMVLLALRVPVGISMALASIVGFLAVGFNLSTVGGTLYTAVASTSLITIPGYILAGAIMANGGISRYLLDCLRSWLGHVPGGMAIIAVLSCGLFAAITGSSSATIAAIGGLMIPAMVDSNYDKPFSMGLIASSGSLGILIPPSIPLVLYATVAGCSVSKLFAAGMLPGFLVMGMFIVYIVIYSLLKKRGTLPREGWGARLRKTVKALPALLLPVFILGSIYKGVMTPTEAAAFACVYALLVSWLVYREYSFKKFVAATKEAAKSTATIMLIVTACSMFSLFLTTTRIPHRILEIVAQTNMSAIQLVIICNLIILVMGCFMDGVSIMLVAAPLMVPIVSSLGYDLIQFGVVMTMGIQVGQLTPPVGMNLFMVAGMEKEPIVAVIRGSLAFLAMLVVSWIMVSILPQITMFATAVFS